MPTWLLLTLYCLIIVVASLAGGLVPMVVRLTHRRMEVALSFVAGVMLGISLLHLLPHALMEQAVATGPPTHGSLETIVLWLLAGLLTMFVLERFFCFHHHDAPDDGPAGGDDHAACEHEHQHRLTWTGAAVGLTLHTLIAGMALAASVESDRHGGAVLFAGLGTFLVIVLHKPFDSLTILTLMAKGNRSKVLCHTVNVLFSLAVPIGAGLFILGLSTAGADSHRVLAAALAFSAGTFLCIALSDLLPELQFHQHDRVRLTVALLLGLAIAWGVSRLEAAQHGDDGHDHGHDHAAGAVEEAVSYQLSAVSQNDLSG